MWYYYNWYNDSPAFKWQRYTQFQDIERPSAIKKTHIPYSNLLNTWNKNWKTKRERKNSNENSQHRPDL